MAKITALRAREILDSKADPVVEVELTLDDRITVIDSVPSGASTGDSEAVEIRDGDTARYDGKGVLKAVANVNGYIRDNILNKEIASQTELDALLISLDNTPNKSFLGSNAILPVSLAFARSSARLQGIHLFQYLSGGQSVNMPRPQVLVMEGGRHGDWATDIQEFMILSTPGSFSSYSEILRASIRIFRELGKILESKNYSTGVGFEGAFCPREISSNEEAFELIIKAVEVSGFSLPDQFVLAVDVAASEFYQDNRYVLKSEADQIYTPDSWAEKISYWAGKYPIFSIEDPFDQSQWPDWSKVTSVLGSSHQIVGDDLVVTNKNLIQKAIQEKSCNAVIIKPNQIGTVTETLEAVKIAQQAGFNTVVSHRGGETIDSFISDLVVGTSSPQCKFGGPNRGERLAKYNRLLAIEAGLAG